ncbi:MAG: extracellular solute-binding protein [Desulfobacterales bacterium]|nr:extracellular solute-binding protein [Pseudomonadota bacterium]MBU4354732.1 extracellular solute-binding protein [Pseudomonadota bacterium]MCG2773154.1 extracellular solute-binding protein [Desulfobacterales bacterium]
MNETSATWKRIVPVRALRWLFCIFLIAFHLPACQQRPQNEVVVYTSLDQIFSEPVFKNFEEHTAIKVKALYDTETSKTVGLVNRLIAEKEHPQADVFWNSEIVRTILLKKKGILQPYVSPSAAAIPPHFKDAAGYWTGFAARARVLVVNRNLLPEGDYPRSLQALVAPRWKGRAGMALPLFGTTNTHMLALYQLWGPQKTEAFFEQGRANQVQVLLSNSVVRDRVADGVLAFGLTDSDDAYVGKRRGKPVDMVYPDQDNGGTLLIPNTVGLLAGAPHPENGKKLIDYLLSEKVEETLAFGDSMQIPLRPGVKRPAHCPSVEQLTIAAVDYDALANNIEEYSERLRTIFLHK